MLQFLAMLQRPLLLKALFLFATAALVVVVTTTPQAVYSSKFTSNITQTVYTSTASTVMPSPVLTAVEFVKPKRVSIPVAFYSQAPTKNWAEPFQNACEEATALLVHYYLTKQLPTLQAVELDITHFTQWVARSGYDTSVSLADLAVIIKGYLGYNTTILENPTRQTLEQLLDSGYPIIAPLAGKKLENPYFSNGGPYYHVALITGYTNTSYILQEVGTNAGANYEYKKSVLEDALHDYTSDPLSIESGVKRILVIEQTH